MKKKLIRSYIRYGVTIGASVFIGWLVANDWDIEQLEGYIEIIVEVSAVIALFAAKADSTLEKLKDEKINVKLNETNETLRVRLGNEGLNR